MSDIALLHSKITERFKDAINSAHVAFDELTIEVEPKNLLNVSLVLRDSPDFDFKLLVDVCGVDYLHYGLSEWETNLSTEKGFERGVDHAAFDNPPKKRHRFAAVYHLLSLTLNQRIRIRVLLDENAPVVDSVIHIWPSANWFEREAFDLYGILFAGHPDLRRILTDYGFIGHPFRKDFPLIGNVEVRYDANLKRVVYEPVSIQPRVLEPKVIRSDNRYKKVEE